MQVKPLGAALKMSRSIVTSCWGGFGKQLGWVQADGPKQTKESQIGRDEDAPLKVLKRKDRKDARRPRVGHLL